MNIYYSSLYFLSSVLILSRYFLPSVYISTADHFPILSIIAYFFLQIILRSSLFILQWITKHLLPPIVPLLSLIYYFTPLEFYSDPSLWFYRTSFLHSVNFSLSECFISIEFSHSEWCPLFFPDEYFRCQMFSLFHFFKLRASSCCINWSFSNPLQYFLQSLSFIVRICFRKCSNYNVFALLK